MRCATHRSISGLILASTLLMVAASACARSGLGRGETERPDWDGGEDVAVPDAAEDVAPDAVDAFEDVPPDVVDVIEDLGPDVIDIVEDVAPDVPAVCGDGVVEGREECDDGVFNSDLVPDACRTDCRLPFCGDGVVDEGEPCDDGNGVELDACSNDCLRPAVPCLPCDDSVSCGRGADACVELIDGTFCGRGCETNMDCPLGTLCDDARTVDRGRIPQCVPELTVCSDCFDRDGDGYGIGVACLGFDCDDTDASINPAAEEICDDIDNNCNDQNDEVCPPDLIVDAETIELDGTQLFDHVIVRNGGVIRVVAQEEETDSCGPGAAGCLQMTARWIEVLANSAIDATGSGRCSLGTGPDAGFGRGLVNAGPAGGGYGGAGGAGPGITGGAPYGQEDGPTIQMGSAGGDFRIVERGFDAVCDDLVGLNSTGGAGGGCIDLVAGRVDIAGVLRADGDDGEDAATGSLPRIVDAGAGGSGGGIRIATERMVLSRTGVIAARGGDGGVGGTYRPGGEGESCIGNGGGGGGGGRVKIVASALRLSGVVTVVGGSGGTGPQNDATGGADGTIVAR